MTCVKMRGGYVCGNFKPLIPLKEYGVDVWLEMHTFIGPIFYRKEKSTRHIDDRYLTKKMWDAFYKWQEAQDKKAQMKRDRK